MLYHRTAYRARLRRMISLALLLFLLVALPLSGAATIDEPLDPDGLNHQLDPNNETPQVDPDFPEDPENPTTPLDPDDPNLPADPLTNTPVVPVVNAAPAPALLGDPPPTPAPDFTHWCGCTGYCFNNHHYGYGLDHDPGHHTCAAPLSADDILLYNARTAPLGSFSQTAVSAPAIPGEDSTKTYLSFQGYYAEFDTDELEALLAAMGDTSQMGGDQLTIAVLDALDEEIAEAIVGCLRPIVQDTLWPNGNGDGWLTDGSPLHFRLEVTAITLNNRGEDARDALLALTTGSYDITMKITANPNAFDDADNYDAAKDLQLPPLTMPVLKIVNAPEPPDQGGNNNNNNNNNGSGTRPQRPDPQPEPAPQPDPGPAPDPGPPADSKPDPNDNPNPNPTPTPNPDPSPNPTPDPNNTPGNGEDTEFTDIAP